MSQQKGRQHVQPSTTYNYTAVNVKKPEAIYRLHRLHFEVVLLNICC